MARGLRGAPGNQNHLPLRLQLGGARRTNQLLHSPQLQIRLPRSWQNGMPDQIRSSRRRMKSWKTKIGNQSCFTVHLHRIRWRRGKEALTSMKAPPRNPTGPPAFCSRKTSPLWRVSAVTIELQGEQRTGVRLHWMSLQRSLANNKTLHEDAQAVEPEHNSAARNTASDPENKPPQGKNKLHPQRKKDEPHNSRTSVTEDGGDSRADDRNTRELPTTTGTEAEKAKASHKIFAEAHAEAIAVVIAEDPEEIYSPRKSLLHHRNPKLHRHGRR